MPTPTPAGSGARAGDGELALVSVVVTTRNRADSLARLLASLSRQAYPRLETIVYDDASDPPLVCAGGAVLVIRGEEPRGACVGRNRCFEAMRGEFVLTLDDDTELDDPELIAKAVRLARRNPDVGMLVLHEVLPGAGEEPPGAGEAGGGALEIARPAFYGCLIRTDALRRAGMYLVEAFGYYAEEVELAIRMLDAGYRTVYVPWLTVRHHADPRGRDLRRIYRLTARNTMLTVLLRYPLRDVPRGLAGGMLMFLKRPPVAGLRDWTGPVWLAAQLLARLPLVLRSRAPVRRATLLRHRELGRRPAPAPLVPAPEPARPAGGPASPPV